MNGMSILYRSVSAIVLSTAACTADPPLGPETALQVTLIAPVEGATVAQNVPSIGCPAHSFRGYGLQLQLDWDDASHPDGIGVYEVWVQRMGAQHPLVDGRSEGSEYSILACNSFVIDRNLAEWQWRVRAIVGNGEAGPWSETAEFAFAPCRLEGGIPCSAPPGA